MPLWLVFHPPGTFEDEESKGAFAKDITTLYTDAGMPAFYVVVQFVKQAHSDTWVGGERRKASDRPFIRFSVDHIHVRLPKDPQEYARVTSTVDRLIEPHVKAKGYDWEYHIDETERLLWKINGLAPPAFKGDDEKVWVAENRPVPPEEMHQTREKHGLA